MKHTLGPWEWMKDPEGPQDPTRMLVGSKPKTLLMSVMPPIPKAPASGDFEANLRLIALAPEMKKALLKVKQLWAIGQRVPTCRPGTSDYVELIKQGVALETEIDAVIDQVEAEPASPRPALTGLAGQSSGSQRCRDD